MTNSERCPLTPVVTSLLGQVKDLYARCEAMRLVLETHGLLPHDEYQNRRAECETFWSETMSVEWSRAIQDAADKAIQQLLEKHEGTKQ